MFGRRAILFGGLPRSRSRRYQFGRRGEAAQGCSFPGPVAHFAGGVTSVAVGGFSLLRLGIGRRLNDFQAGYFRAGHAHAGVLLVVCLVVLDLLDRQGAGSAVVWTLGTLLLVGTLAQSGGMFLHMAIGQPGKWSPGNTLTSIGAVLLAAALIGTAVEVIRAA